MKAENWAEIRRLNLTEGLSQRQIAKLMGLSCKTIRRALRMSEYKPDKANIANRPSKLEPYKKDITELLEKYPGITAQRIFEIIQERNYSGKTTIVEDYIRAMKHFKQEAYLRINVLPGEEAQVDWADCGYMKIGEHTRKLSCFVMVLSYSRLMYLEFTLSQRLDDFLRCHVNAFRFFGGLPTRILYDNLKSVVLVRLGSLIKFNPKFESFSGYYLFKPLVCNVRKANEKGRVESSIGYIRKNFLMGREFSSFTDLQTQAVQWRDEKANFRTHGTTRKRPIDLYQAEKDKLKPLPPKDYDTATVTPVKVTGDCRVKFDSNTYSVPFEYAGWELTLKAGPDKVMVYNDTKLIARHQRSYEKYMDIEEPNHYQELLAFKKKARRNKIIDMFTTLGEGAKDYLEGLKNAELNLHHHIHKIFNMVDIYGKTEVLGAINHALEYDAFGWDYIQNIILQQRAKRGCKKNINPIAIVGNEEFSAATVEERDLNLYDNLYCDDNETD